MRDAPSRLSLRIVRHDPLFTVATLLLLTLGIGALGALLALYRGTLAQPPPLPNWERLLVLRGATAQSQRLPLSFPDFEDLRRDVPALADLALTRAATVTIEAGQGEAQRVAASRVTPNLANVLGVALLRGPGFAVPIGQSADQVIISERLWRNLFAGQALERLQLRMGGRAVAVVGVLPMGLRFPTPEVDLWLPLAPAGNEARRDYAFTTAWGLLRPGHDVGAAREQIAARVASLAVAFPQSHAELRIEPFAVEDDLLGPQRPLIAVFALVGTLVFIAVAGNIAALSAARELARRSATVTRLVLGAGHRRLLGTALRVAAGFTAVATAGGGLLAWSIVRAAEVADRETFTALRATVDIGVGVGMGAGILILVAAQVLPTWWLQRRVDLAAPGSRSTRATSADRGTVRSAGLIVALQLAMCFATVGTLVLARQTLSTLEQIDLGFAREERYSMALGVPELDHVATITGFEAAIAEVSRIPGIDAAAVISRLPLLPGASSVGVIPASLGLPGEAALPVDVRLAVGEVQATLGLRLLRGRFPDINDQRDKPAVAVIDRQFAEQWFAGRDPLGVRFRLQIDPTIEWQVIGVMDAVRWRSFDGGEAPSMLLAAAQFDNIAPMRSGQLLLSGQLDPATGVEPVRAALRRGMPLLSADTPQPLAAIIDGATTPVRLAHRLLQLLTGIALLLALLGVGALLLYRHERQRRAVGIRLCLGARRSQIVGTALADSLALAFIGGVAGTALIWTARLLPDSGRLLASEGFALAWLSAAAVVTLLALLGGIAPAWRIATLKPRDALHDAN